MLTSRSHVTGEGKGDRQTDIERGHGDRDTERDREQPT